MQCPRLNELPSPPRGLTGWPWTEESDRLAESDLDRPWPRITIVTPSFNQGDFIEAAIRSVLLQGYPDLEYIVLDGGSSDRSASIISKYEPWLHHWESGPDGGQSWAINRGLAMGSGSYATWINSDDMLCRNAFRDHAIQYGFDAEVVYAGVCQHIDAAGRTIGFHQGNVHTLEDLVRIRQVWRSGGYIDQPATLFPAALVQSVGGLNSNNHRTMDYELWGELLLKGVCFRYTSIPFGAFRIHSAQKTNDGPEQTRSLVDLAVSFARRSSALEPKRQDAIVADIVCYQADYKQRRWRGTGRLARLGLPVRLVELLRHIKAAFLKPIRILRGAGS